MPTRLHALCAALAVWPALALPASLQDRMLYFPQRASVAEMERSGLRAWPSAGDFRGLVAQPAGLPRGTAIVFHGNAGHAGHRGAYAAALTRLGVRTILAEYPAYGPRGGEVGEASMVADAAQSIALARREFGAPLLVIGESLGAGVAAAAVARAGGDVAALMLVTPWDRIESVARFHYPWLPLSWLLHDRYDSAENLARFGGPVLIVVAANDSIVPARFGEALFDALHAPKRLVSVPAAGHNDWIGRVDAAWWRQAVDFLLPP